MTRQKKHSKVEITSLLAQADDLARQGKVQSDIARALGVSVMTLHRWRKAQGGAEGTEPESSNFHSNERTRIADLQQENLRLRRLVTDLLLEKVQLEEALQKSSAKRASR